MSGETPKMLILIMGVSGTGKSVIGKALSQLTNFKFIDADSFHSDKNIAKMRDGVALSEEDRLPWLQDIRAAIEPALNGSQKTILACSALKKTYRDFLLRPGEHFKIVFLHGPKETIKSRLSSRENHFMNPNLLDSQLEILNPPDQGLRIDISYSPEEILKQIQESGILLF